MKCNFRNKATLTYLIIVQDVINVQDGKSQKINKRAGWQSKKKQEKCRLKYISLMKGFLYVLPIF